jgi:hypothetical protein
MSSKLTSPGIFRSTPITLGLPYPLCDYSGDFWTQHSPIFQDYAFLNFLSCLDARVLWVEVSFTATCLGPALPLSYC